MKITLKSGKEVTLKEVSLDERDEMFDSCEYKFDKKGNLSDIKNPHSTITKWLRLGLDGDVSDKALKVFSIEDRTETFLEMQKFLHLGE